MAAKLCERAQVRASSPGARPRPRRARPGSTMKLAVATCPPLPARLGPIFALPTTVPSSSTATVVRPGGVSIHSARPSASSSSHGYVYVSPAATIIRKNGQIAGQSSAAASRIVTPPGARLPRPGGLGLGRVLLAARAEDQVLHPLGPGGVGPHDRRRQPQGVQRRERHDLAV